MRRTAEPKCARASRCFPSGLSYPCTQIEHDRKSNALSAMARFFGVARRRQHGEVERASCRVRICFQADRGRAPLGALDGRVLDPLAQRPIVPQGAADTQAKPAGTGIVKSWRLAAS